jgi:hypothetical protein
MLLTEITHKATLKSIVLNNLDVSVFENIYELRTHLKKMIQNNYKIKHNIVPILKYRKSGIYQNAKRKEYLKKYQKEYYQRNKLTKVVSTQSIHLNL